MQNNSSQQTTPPPPTTQGQQRSLKFIHITKTAGSSIEEAGHRAGLQWGKFHSSEYGWYHRIFSQIPQAVVQKYDWFLVVRNPYNRILSEYYCNNVGVHPNVQHTVKQMNEKIIDQILNRSQTGNHYTEQYKYLPPPKAPPPTTTTTAPKIHVLKFENLATEFRALMELYDLPHVTLDNVHENKSKWINKFTTRDFSPAVLTLINRVYYQDFIQFKYDFIHPPTPIITKRKPSLALQIK